MKPLHQKLVKWIFFILVGVASAGTLLDAISNAVSLVSPSFTYIGSAILATLWLLTELAAILFGIPWVTGGSRKVRFKSLGPKLRLGLLGVLILLWIPRLGDIPTSRNESIPAVNITFVNQTEGDLHIDRRGEFVLWLPTALYDGAPRVGGRFSLALAGETGYLDSPIIIPAKASAQVKAELLGQQQFIRFLERGDTDLTLMARTSSGISSSPTIPFSRAALNSRYIEWQITSK